MYHRTSQNVLVLLSFLFPFLKILGQNPKVIRIDPALAYGGGISEYFMQIEYIPLETTTESLFGSANKFVITSNSFIINDFDTKAVLFFSSGGLFLNKVKWGLISPLEIRYNLESDRVELSSYKLGKKKTRIFSTSGKFLQDDENPEKIEPFNLILLSNGYKIENRPFLSAFNYRIVDSPATILNIYKGAELHRSFFSFNPARNFLKVNLFNSLIENPQIGGLDYAYLSIPIENEVLKVSKDTFRRAFKFVFPVKYSLPPNIANIKNRTEYLKYQEIIEKPNNYIFSVHNFFVAKNLIFFRAETTLTSYTVGSQENNSVNLIFDTASHKLSSFERISPNSLSSYLPISSGNSLTAGLYSHGVYLYNFVSSLEMFTAKQNTKDKNPKYPPVLQEYFKTQNRKSNPVIVRMKLKE